MPHRILISICDMGQSSVDDDNFTLVGCIEEAAGQQWNPQSAKIIRADPIIANRIQRMFATRIPKPIGDALTTAERRTCPGTGGNNTGKRLEPIKYLIEKRHLRGSVMAVCHLPGNPGSKDVVWIKAQPYLGQADKCLHEQAGSNQENQRERDLEYHQNVAEETRTSSSSCLLAS